MTSYTHKEKSIVKRILVKCKFAIIGNKIEEKESISALWDTGAMCTCISETLANELGLQPDDYGLVTGADNQPFTAPIYSIHLKIGRFDVPFLRVYGLPMEGRDHKAIIGMDVMINGDLSISNYKGKTILTFREPSIMSIDYVEELQKYKITHQSRLKSNNNKCPCGSGREWKNCHGKES